MADLRLGPDSARYMLAGGGHAVARPFNLRWFLPTVCRNSAKRWWLAWALSWPIAAIVAGGTLLVLANAGVAVILDRRLADAEVDD